ncbi:50S ribosomal protein L37ae [Candidatus Woesearchaeota archaeon]|nr:50S ribosomal protein L37ae [Candidatus Woesearchaeota archaeon]
MVKVEKLGSAKRFGARYGSKPKHEFAKIEKEQRKRHKCPYCHNFKVKRVAFGIWQCKKCNSKFTGKAYSIEASIAVKGHSGIDKTTLEMPQNTALEELSTSEEKSDLGETEEEESSNKNQEISDKADEEAV